MHVTHRPMVIESCVKYSMIISKDKNCGWKTKSCQEFYSRRIHVQNMVCQSQSKQKLLVGHEDMPKTL